ncbi:MAG TPA: 3-deoxy-manno-octulosonate cytidylyltransferase [Pseudomonadales bacterium]|nr:3-deoxy-manno-octulosonate cytidylyltransferase [Pseudomonadales bacterium]
MSFVVVIPARYASTRLPGKPLLDIAGKPMIQHVWQRAMASEAEQVLIATDDQRIADVARSFGAEVAMTRADHPSGTDRLQEVAEQQGWSEQVAVVNVQGDEPLIPAAVINQVAAVLLANPRADVATLCESITDENQFRDPNAVKVVTNEEGEALYFSRAPIAWPRDGLQTEQNGIMQWGCRHIGIYAYRAGFLHRYVSWPPCMLEQIEKLEQLRALYKGAVIQVQEACLKIPAGVDTQHDLDVVRNYLQTHGG